MNTDPLRRTLERLPFHEPDEDRAARTRARCHAALARQRRRAASQAAPAPRWESALIGTLCAAYFTEIVRYALRFYGVL